MDIGTYAAEAAAEETHWWFVGRRKLFGRILEECTLPRDATILDVGTSTRTNLRLLRDIGFCRVTGLDLSEEAIRYCEAKGFGPVMQGNICDLPFPDESYDFILATDIIEHVDDDALALRETRRVLVPGGRVLITVPAFQSLWGLQDERSFHKRRYRLRPLLQIVQAAGLQPVRYHYFNYLLFCPIWLARRMITLLGLRLDSEAQVNTPALNRIMTVIFDADIRTAPIIKPPFGVSILILARKAEG